MITCGGILRRVRSNTPCSPSIQLGSWSNWKAQIEGRLEDNLFSNFFPSHHSYRVDKWERYPRLEIRRKFADDIKRISPGLSGV